jgi:hypothetical protein
MMKIDEFRRRPRTAALLVGLSATAAMLVIGSAASGGSDAGQTSLVSDGMTTGETTTLSVITGTLAPVVAVPPVKAPPYGGGG